MKNVLQIMPEFGIAGAETMCESLCYELQNSGQYNVHVVSLFDLHTAITQRMEANGISIFYLQKKRGFDLSVVISLYRLMKSLKIDIIHTHRYVMQYAIPAAVFAGVSKRVHTVHNIAEKEVDSLRQVFAYLFYHICNVTPVSISPIVQQSVMMRYGLNEKHTPVVYNGINFSRCLKINNHEAHEPFRFIHIGRFSLQKNHGAIIQAAEILKSKGLHFAITLIGGSGNEEERKLEVIQKGLDDVIFFSGIQSDVFSFLNESDCFLLPSLYEGMPVTLIEAMGCGLPIIASAVGGVPDMIDDEESGLLISPTAEKLAEAMERIIVDPELRASLGKCALEKSKIFSAHNMFVGYNKIYNM